MSPSPSAQRLSFRAYRPQHPPPGVKFRTKDGRGSFGGQLSSTQAKEPYHGTDRHPGSIGPAIDLGALTRNPASGVFDEGRSSSYVSCKDALQALKSIPEGSRVQLRKIGFPAELMSWDDCDNVDYAEQLGEYIVKELWNVEILTLAVPDDLAITGKDDGQYDFFSWTLHKIAIDSLTGGRLKAVRVTHPVRYAEDTIDVYHMHNVDGHLKGMVIGEAKERALRRTCDALMRSRRHPPSVADDDDTLFAIMHALDYEAWSDKGFSVTFGPRHPGEIGSVVTIKRRELGSDSFVDEIESAAQWWSGKCPFCIGNGYCDSRTDHPTSECPRGGGGERYIKLGRLIFQEGLKARSGCSVCACPTRLCNGREDTRRGNDRRRLFSPLNECRFGEVVYDVIVNLCQSACDLYHAQLALDMGFGVSDNPTYRELALWLREPLEGREGIVSRYVRAFLLWTRAAKEQLRKRRSGV